jgi:UTP--glucose-1-phosphate uridylyltransferase
MEITKVVIPVAGLGVRSLPATKNVPKEMLPVFNKPVVQYVVEEAQAAGCTDVVLVTNRTKSIIEDHFDYNLALEAFLERTGKKDKLAMVRATAEMANIITVRQKRRLGLGHAVLCAKEVVKDGPFALMVGDDLMFSMEPGIKQLITVAQSEHMSVVGVVEVPADKVSSYGIIDGEEFATGMYRVKDLVEKPQPSKAPSKPAIVGRYVLYPEVFGHIEGLTPTREGEYQLTEALRGMAKDNRLLAVKIRGRRFDTGDWVEYLTANIYFALQDEELHDPLVERLRELLPNTK